jgi:hypothetical protein
VTFLRSHVTGSNGAILSEVGRMRAVSLVGTHHGPGMCWDTALGHLVILLGNNSLGVWICMTSQDWRLSSHKGQWCFYDRSLPRGGIKTLGYHYGLPRMNAGEHSYGGMQAFGLHTLKRFNQPMWKGGNQGGLYATPGAIFFFM